MNNDEKVYASHFLRAWKQYHKINSHQMNIEGKANGLLFSWGAPGNGQSFQLMCKRPDGLYQSVSQDDKQCLLLSIVNKSLEVIGFDTTLNLFMNVRHHLDTQLSKHSLPDLDTYGQSR